MTFLAAQAIFYYMAAASVVSATLAVTRKNPVHSMLWVLSLFMHVAGIFLLLNAEFLAAVQIIVYAGAILIFYLFVLMLLDLPGEEARPRFGRHWPIAAVGALGLVVLAWLAQIQTLDSTQVGVASAPAVGVASAPAVGAAEDPSLGSLSGVGTALFGPFALPFEMASLVLLAAIVGAVVLARRKAGS
jgi:NADH-quinone oxidoreductase subunit J